MNTEDRLMDILEEIDPELWADCYEDFLEDIIFFQFDLVESPDDI
jgi:hypothetical protein